MISLNRNWILTFLLAITVIWVLDHMTPPFVSQNILLRVTKNKAPIGSIHQARDVESTREIWVDKLDLNRKYRLLHPKLGNVAGYSDNYFIDVTHSITVKRPGTYEFIIGSDDGFSFSIDGKEICSFAADRPFVSQTCPIELSQGSHLVELKYFQGGGNSGLSVEYARKGESKHWFGKSSKWITF